MQVDVVDEFRRRVSLFQTSPASSIALLLEQEANLERAALSDPEESMLLAH